MKIKGLLLVLLIANHWLNGNVGGDVSIPMQTQRHWAFEENKGQVLGRDSADVLFFYKQSPLTIFLRNTGLTYQFTQVHRSKENGDRSFGNHSLEMDDNELPLNKIETYRMDIELLGAHPYAEIVKEQASEDYIQYYNHNALEVRSYQRIVYKNIYAGIDWVVYLTNSEQLISNNLVMNKSNAIKYDFIVHPGADPHQIKMKINWAEEIKLDEQGNLIMKNRLGEVKEDAPVSFQEQSLVHSRFRLIDSILSFDLGAYDRTKMLIIDPSLAWFTYYGSELKTVSNSTCIDKNGDVYMAGETESTTMIADGGYQLSYVKSIDAFLAKFSPDGQRIWATYYGGEWTDRSYGCAVDENKNVYMTGLTGSRGNIAFNGYKNYIGSGLSVNAFLVKFNSKGNRIWGTYFGYRSVRGNVIAIRGHQVYIAGITSFLTNSSSLKDTSLAVGGHQMSYGGGTNDGFIAKFDTLGQFYWSSYYGGSGDDQVFKIAIDNNDDVYCVGNTNSISQISYLGFQNNLNKGLPYTNNDGFIVKFNSNGTRLWGSYLGSPYKDDIIRGCAVDKDNNLVIVGRTADSSFMTQGTMFDSTVGFTAKLSSNGNKLWAKVFGTGLVDCTTDDDKNIYLAGIGSTDFGNLYYNGFKTYQGFGDIVISRLDTSGNLNWSTYYGGIGNEGGFGICVSKNNDVFVTGFVAPSSGTPSDNLAYKGHQNSRMNAFWNGFLMKICQDPQVPEIVVLTNNSTTICEGKNVVLTTQVKHGGLSPQYIWKKNGQTLPHTGASYTTNQLKNGDIIECWMLSSAACITMDTAKSNKLVFTVIKPDTTYARDTVCEGEVYRLGNQRITSSGYYQERLQDRNGCDSLVILQLWFKPRSFYSYSHTTTCAQPDYFFNGALRKVSGIYKDTLTNYLGCDSIITLNLTVKKPSSFTYPYELCTGDSVLFGTRYISSAGDYQRIISNVMGCDSTITMQVTLLTPVHKDSFIQACPPYSYKGKGYDRTTQILDTTYSVQGCDSIYWKLDVQISPKPITRQRISHEVCDTIRIGGRLFYSSFDYIDTIRTQNALRCDSIYQPIRYTIYETPSSKFYERTKDTFLRGQVLRLRAGSAQNYLWSTGHTAQILDYKIVEDAQLFLVTWNHALCRDTSYLDLWAFDPIVLDFPTGFNPQSQHTQNRYFKPNYTGKLDAIHFDIYNRLGEKVYSSSNIDDMGWDGTYKNQLAPNGVYGYILEYTSFRSRYIKTGEVMLVR